MDGSSSCFVPPSQWPRVVAKVCGGCMLTACWGCLNSGGIWVSSHSREGASAVLCSWHVGAGSELGRVSLLFAVCRCCLNLLTTPCVFFKYFLQLLQNKVVFLYQGVVPACCGEPFKAMKNMDPRSFFRFLGCTLKVVLEDKSLVSV